MFNTVRPKSILGSFHGGHNLYCRSLCRALSSGLRGKPHPPVRLFYWAAAACPYRAGQLFLLLFIEGRSITHERVSTPVTRSISAQFFGFLVFSRWSVAVRPRAW